MDNAPPSRSGRPHLPLARYGFEFVALDTFPLKEDPRGLWHGVFGRALREICCVVDRPECPGCDLLHRCQYSFLFSAPRPPNTDLMPGLDPVPVPHVFRV